MFTYLEYTPFFERQLVISGCFECVLCSCLNHNVSCDSQHTCMSLRLKKRSKWRTSLVSKCKRGGQGRYETRVVCYTILIHNVYTMVLLLQVGLLFQSPSTSQWDGLNHIIKAKTTASSNHRERTLSMVQHAPLHMACNNNRSNPIASV